MNDKIKSILQKIESNKADLAEKPWCAYRKGTNGSQLSVDYVLDMIRSRNNDDFQEQFPPRAEFDTEQEAIEYAMIHNIKDSRYPFIVEKQEVGKPRRI